MPSLDIKSGNSSGAPTPPPIGTIIDDGKPDGALQLSSVLGYGGYGVVYRAQSTTGTAFAVKCLLRSAPASNPKQLQRQRRLHQREVALHKLAAGTGTHRHPHIITLHRVIEPSLPDVDGSLTVPSPYTFLVMDFAPCGDLFTLILHKQVYLGRAGLCARVFAQLADAVSHCHKLGIYHRDLKPENVLCWDNGQTVKLADFGLATTERRSKEWRTGSVYHMSPECQNGNANSPPYSPLANDIWSLAILLLNLLTARNPWAKASPTDPTFSAYLNGPSNFLPQVLPISSGLNSVLVRALDVQWERREAFGVKGLADGVARLCVDKEDYTKRRSVAYRHKGMGMYSPDVVFEGGMARCPWEVGMHIPSGSSGNDEDDVPIHARVEQPPKPEPKPKVHQREKVVAAYNSVDATLVEIPRSQPSKPKKAHERSPVKECTRWSPDPSVDSSSQIQFAQPPSSAAIPDDSMSDIRFAATSENQPVSSATDSSSPSSSSASSGSLYTATKTPAPTKPGYDPCVSETSSHLDAQADADRAYAYELAYVADPGTPREMFEEKRPYADPYAPLSGKYDGNKRRQRYRGRQPYPQVTARNQTRGAASRRKPDLKINLDIQNPRTFLPSMSPEASRSRSPAQRNVKDLRMRAREESVSSCPFAYTVSRSSYSQAGDLIPSMDVDGERGRGRDADVHMTSPLGEVDVNGASFAGSFDGRSISPYGSPRRQPVTSFGNRSFSGEPVQVVGRSPISPSAPAIDCNGRDIVKISRSTYGTTLTSPTDAELAYDRSRVSGSERSEQVSLNYLYGYNGNRSSTPSPTSSAFGIRSTTSRGTEQTGTVGSMETDLSRSRYQSNLGVSGPSWADELSRVLEEEVPTRSAQMDVDAFDMPSFPGTFPASNAPSARPELRGFSPQPSSGMRSAVGSVHSRVGSSQHGYGLDILAQRRSGNVYDSRLGSINSAFQHIAPSTYSNEPRTHDLSAQASGADEAIRQLHAYAVGPQSCPWTSDIDNSGWGKATTSFSSASNSTRPAQTFMAITTDSQVNPASHSSVTDLQEFAPYVNYADSLSANDVSRQPVNSAFVEQEPTQSFRQPAAASKVPFPTKATNPSTASSQRESVTKSRRRTGSRTQSLLKFVSRRPFSSSGSGFVRSATPSFALDTEANIKHSTNSSSHLPSSSSSGGTVSTPGAVTALSAQHKKFSDSNPHTVSTEYSNSNSRSPLPRAETHPNLARSTAINKAPKQTASTPKLRAWSFSRTRSGIHSKRRSRSLSPEPTRGTAREVLSRLRSARNWFWVALSGLTPAHSSGAGLRSRKSHAERFSPLGTQLIGVAA